MRSCGSVWMCVDVVSPVFVNRSFEQVYVLRKGSISPFSFFLSLSIFSISHTCFLSLPPYLPFSMLVCLVEKVVSPDKWRIVSCQTTFEGIQFLGFVIYICVCVDLLFVCLRCLFLTLILFSLFVCLFTEDHLKSTSCAIAFKTLYLWRASLRNNRSESTLLKMQYRTRVQTEPVKMLKPPERTLLKDSMRTTLYQSTWRKHSIIISCYL